MTFGVNRYPGPDANSFGLDHLFDRFAVFSNRDELTIRKVDHAMRVRREQGLMMFPRRSDARDLIRVDLHDLTITRMQYDQQKRDHFFFAVSFFFFAGSCAAPLVIVPWLAVFGTASPHS